MIGHIRGTLLAKHAGEALVEAGGLGYELQVPMSTWCDLPEVGKDVALFAHLVVREDAHTLFAFATEEERTLFRSLIRISGVGAKLAVTILSGISVRDFVDCVRQEDAARLVKLPGVGKKTASRLIVEMRDKLDAGGAAGSASSGGASAPAGARAEAHSALLALGYRHAEVVRLLDRVDTEGRRTEDIIRDALKASG